MVGRLIDRRLFAPIGGGAADRTPGEFEQGSPLRPQSDHVDLDDLVWTADHGVLVRNAADEGGGEGRRRLRDDRRVVGAL